MPKHIPGTIRVSCRRGLLDLPATTPCVRKPDRGVVDKVRFHETKATVHFIGGGDNDNYSTVQPQLTIAAVMGETVYIKDEDGSGMLGRVESGAEVLARLEEQVVDLQERLALTQKLAEQREKLLAALREKKA